MDEAAGGARCPNGLQGPDSCIPSPRDKRLDGSISSTIIDASTRSFPGPEVGENNDSCSHELPSVTVGEIYPPRSPCSVVL